MKKIASIVTVIAAFALVVCLAGCSSGDSSSSSSSNTSHNSGYSSRNYSQSSSSASSSATEAETRTPFVDTLAQLGSFETVTLSGAGDDVVDLPSVGYPCLMDINYNGEHNFIVRQLDAAGEHAGSALVNVIGAYAGTVTNYSEDFDTATTLEIESSGDWTIVVRPMSTMGVLENGASYTGDNVLYIDTDDMSKVTLTNAGEHNFIVHAYGHQNHKTLANEIGNYEGTVAWSDGQCFFVVEDTSGTWSISW